jgi:ribosomal protein L40E
MSFYALQIVCKDCGATSLLGGSVEHDLSQWRGSQVVCRHCGAETSATQAPPVQLRALPRDARAFPSLVKDPPRA